MNEKRIIIVLLICVICGLLTISGRAACINGAKKNTRTGSSNNITFLINAPSNLIATVFSTSQINLSWQDNSNNEDGFEIERRTSDTDYRLLITVNSGITSYSDLGLTPGIIYYYRVRAMNTIGDRSEWSNIASTTTPSFFQSLAWLSVAAGGNHTLALTTDGTVWAWGRNDDWWQLGIGDTSVTSRILPTLIVSDFGFQPFTGVTAISAGSDHNLALKTDGTLWGWGANGFGQLGAGDTETTEAPLQIGTESDWSVVSAGNEYTIGLKSTPAGGGTLWAWGNNYYGQLGDGTIDNRTTPRQIGVESDWSSVAAGENHTIGLKSTGTLWAWGDNGGGQLGDGLLNRRHTPSQIGAESDWSVVSAGYSYTIGIKGNNTLWVWGYNIYGQLGDGTTNNRCTPRQIGTDSDWAEIAAGDTHTLSLKINSTLWVWGYNGYGQLGDGTIDNRTTPSQIGVESDWSSVAAGGNHTIGIKGNNTLWVWGYNIYGQLGLGDTVNRNLPYLLGGFPAVPYYLIATPLGLSQIELSWQDNSNNETGFKIERKMLKEGTWEQIATVGANPAQGVTSYFDISSTGFSTFPNHYYRIMAYNSFGNSLYSEVAVNAPTNLESSFLTEQLPPNVYHYSATISWTDNSKNEDGFQIERKFGENGTWELIETVGPDVLSYSGEMFTTSINPGVGCRVRAYKGTVYTEYSNEEYIAKCGLMGTEVLLLIGIIILIKRRRLRM